MAFHGERESITVRLRGCVVLVVDDDDDVDSRPELVGHAWRIHLLVPSYLCMTLVRCQVCLYKTVTKSLN